MLNLIPKSIIVHGDVNRLKQVFLNIIINSIDAVLPDGKIILKTLYSKKGSHVTVFDI